MNTAKPFYTHESDHRIMIKKDREEVNNWTDNLEYINEELEYLVDIVNSMLINSLLYQQLHEIMRENQLRLGVLYRYEGTMRNAIECDTMECDAFYLHKHEKNRNEYLGHIKKYQNIKSKVLSKILMTVKR